MKHTAFKGPKQSSAFRNNYVAAFLIVAALFLSNSILAQTAPARNGLNTVNTLGNNNRNGAYRNVLYIPLDTVPTLDSGAIAYLNSVLYQKSADYWRPVSKARQLTDSSFIVGGDTIVISGIGDLCRPKVDLTGTTDASSAIQSLINAGCKYIFLPAGIYKFDNPVQMKDGVTIAGAGRATLIKLTKNQPGFKCGWALGGSKTTFRNLSFVGTYSDSTLQDGIFADSCNGILASNITATKLAGAGIRMRRTGFCCGMYTMNAVRGNIISDSYFDSCKIGVKIDTVAEFITVANTTAANGNIGFFTAAGSSNIIGCRAGSNNYGLYITGGSNNAHGTCESSHFPHNKIHGVHIEGATNGYRFVGNMIRQNDMGDVYVETSNNINFESNDLGAISIIVVNSTNTRFINNLIWGPMTWNITGEAPTVIQNGEALNTISIKDVVNNKALNISHSNGRADISGIGRLRMGNDTLNFSNPDAVHIIAGGENVTDSLIITSTTSISKGRIKFGFLNGLVFNELNGNLGLGTSNPGNSIDLVGPGVKNINVEFTDATGHSRMTFNGVNEAAGAQFLFGNSTSPFVPDGFLISSLTGSLALVNQNGDIRFGKQTVINGSNEHARFTNDGSFLFGTTTNDPIKGRFQIYSRSRFDSLMHVNNMPAPSGAYNLVVHDDDSGFKQIPTPGSNTQIIYNDAGRLAGSNSFTWSETNKLLTLTNASGGAGIVINTANNSFPFTVNGNRNGFLQLAANNPNVGSNAASGALFMSDNSALQFYAGSSINSFVPGGVLFSAQGPGGLNIVANAAGAPIAFSKNSVMGAAEHARFTYDGSFLFGTTTDAPSKGRFQIKSRVRIDSTLYINNMAAPTGSYHRVVHGPDSALAQIVTPLVYIANLNQTTTSNPVATVFENNIGTIVWTRISPGEYEGVLSGAFVSGKTHIVHGSSNDSSDGGRAVIFRTDANTIKVLLLDTTGVPTTDGMTDVSIEIRVYP